MRSAKNSVFDLANDRRERGNAPTMSIVATDVGPWMALPAFAPAISIVAAVIFVSTRDRRRPKDDTAPSSDHEESTL